VTRWRIRAAARDAAVAAARAAHPAECCGMLLGTGHLIADAVPARNLAADPDRFLIDPRDHIAARRDGRARGLEVLGFYHSHPHGPAVPSARDAADISYPGHLSLIVGLAAGDVEVRLYLEQDGNFLEVPFVTVG
jgi:proteasome lid subunit RPN8/RPN11